MTNTGWKKYQDHTAKGRLVGYQGKFYRMLISNGTVHIFSNVKWIDNVPPKPSSMSLDNINNTIKIGPYREKRRLNAAIPPESECPSSPVVPGEKRQKRHVTTAEDEFFISLGSNPQVSNQLAPNRTLAPSNPVSNTQSPETLSDGTPASVSPEPITSRLTTRSMTVRDQVPAPAIPTSDILLAHKDLSPDPLALLTKANPLEPYEPRSYKEAISDSYRKMHWQIAMREEVDSLITNGTWILVNLPSNARALGGRWVYKLKRGPAGEIVRHKARWVVRGFEQREGIDFNETFASVVKPMSYKAIFALAAALDWELEQMDVKIAFLYGNVEKTVYVTQPTGFEVPGSEGKVYKLVKALYGLKQSPRVWYNTLAAFLRQLGFESIAANLSVFTNGVTIVTIYVDDILLTGPNKADIQSIKKRLNKKFEMTDLGPCTYYLGITVSRDRANRILRLGQAGYTEKFLADHGMLTSAPAPTPMTSDKFHAADDDFVATDDSRYSYQSAIGSLMYAMLGTRPDIAFAVSVVSRYASNPDESHWKAVKRIFRYLNGTKDWHLVFRGELESLSGYTDADWAGDQDSRRSTSGYVFNIGSAAIS